MAWLCPVAPRSWPGERETEREEGLEGEVVGCDCGLEGCEGWAGEGAEGDDAGYE